MLELVRGGSDINEAYPVWFLKNVYLDIISVKGRVIREELFLSIENVMSQCWQFGLNFTLPQFQEDVMEHLGAKEYLTNIGSCTTKTLYLMKAPLHLLENLVVVNSEKIVTIYDVFRRM